MAGARGMQNVWEERYAVCLGGGSLQCVGGKRQAVGGGQEACRMFGGRGMQYVGGAKRHAECLGGGGSLQCVGGGKRHAGSGGGKGQPARTLFAQVVSSDPSYIMYIKLTSVQK